MAMGYLAGPSTLGGPAPRRLATFAMFSMIVGHAVIGAHHRHHHTHATGACGTRQAKLLKLHKVGSTTVSNILIDYAGRYNLTQCTTNFRQKHRHHSLSCDIILTHAKSLQLIQMSNDSAFWFEKKLPNALSIGVFRDPRERVLSRYFYDMAKMQDQGEARKHHEPAREVGGSTIAPHTGLEGLTEWLDDNLGEQGHHYTYITKARTVPAALAVARRLDVVGDSDRMNALWPWWGSSSAAVAASQILPTRATKS
jgi:hypothetical protein